MAGVTKNASFLVIFGVTFAVAMVSAISALVHTGFISCWYGSSTIFWAAVSSKISQSRLSLAQWNWNDTFKNGFGVFRCPALLSIV